MYTNLIHGIYAITPDSKINYKKIEKVLNQGVFALQYRRKNIDKLTKYHQCKRLKLLCHRYHIPLIINDDVDLCSDIDADGVHLGRYDQSLLSARQKLGANKLIGISCYNKLSFAQTAQKHGANYVAFGSLFSSKTKPNAHHCPLEVVKRAKRQLHIPIVGIGGIDHNNAQLAFKAGCDAVAMMSALFS